MFLGRRYSSPYYLPGCLINIKSVCSTPHTPSPSLSTATPSQGHMTTNPTSLITTRRLSAGHCRERHDRGMEERQWQMEGTAILDAATVRFLYVHFIPHSQGRSEAVSAALTLAFTSKIDTITISATRITTNVPPNESKKHKTKWGEVGRQP